MVETTLLSLFPKSLFNFYKTTIAYFIIFPLTWTYNLYYVINSGLLWRRSLRGCDLHFDLWAGPGESETPLSPVLGMYLLPIVGAVSRMQPRDSDVLLTPLDRGHDWTQLRPLYKFLRFWWAVQKSTHLVAT